MDRDLLAAEIESLHAASFGWALACCGWDRQEAEDVLQTAYLKVLDGRARPSGRSAVKTWLFGVIRNTAVARRRSRWLAALLPARWLDRGAPPPPPVRPDELAALRDEGAQVRAALSRLARRQREVLELVFFHDLTIEDAAAAMGVSLGTARVHYSRGKRRLLRLLSPEDRG